jgi:hypothetical protein
LWPLDYTSAILAVGDPSGDEQAGLASDVAAYLPNRDAWIELRQYATRQHLTIDTAFVPGRVGRRRRAGPAGAARPRHDAVTIEGTRHRAGVWNGQPVTSSIRSRSPCSSSAHRPIRPATCCGCRSSTTRCAEGPSSCSAKPPSQPSRCMFFAPAAALLGIGVLMNPAAAHCATPAGTVNLGPVPDSLTVTTANGETFTLNRQQLTHAATIIAIGNSIDGVGGPESRSRSWPRSPSPRCGCSPTPAPTPSRRTTPTTATARPRLLGLFQMRPQSGWGTVAELMDPTYQARAFFGGPTGPNYPSPRGLLDIPGWQQMDPGEAAQAVEVSAYPDRYRNYAPVADSILTALTSRQYRLGSERVVRQSRRRGWCSRCPRAPGC